MVRRKTISCIQERIAFFQANESIDSSPARPTEQINSIDKNNNNLLAHSAHRKSVPNGRTFEQPCTTKQASYIPSYIRRVEQTNTNQYTSSQRAKQRRSHCQSQFIGTFHHNRGDHRTTDEKLDGTKHALAQLRQKYRKSNSDEIRVKDTVAAMEAQTVPIQEPAPKEDYSMTTAKEDKKNASPVVVMRRTRYRRSMSDPNLYKQFRAVKKLWDEKVELEKQTNTSPNTSRCDSISSVDSVGSSKLSGKQSNRTSNEISPQAEKVPAMNATVESAKPTTPLVTKGPVVAPRPNKSHRIHSPASENSGHQNTAASEDTMTSSIISPSPSKTLSVSEKAMLFGGAMKKSPAKAAPTRHSRSPSPAFERYESDERSIEASTQETDDTHLYDKVPTSNRNDVDSESNIYETIGGSTEDEEALLVNSLRKKANSAKERRRHFSRKESTDSVKTTGSGEAEVTRKNSFLHNHPISRDSSVTCPARVPSRKGSLTSSEPAAHAVYNTEAMIFGPSSPSSDNPPLDELQFQGRRRASSLHKLMTENKTFGLLSCLNMSASESKALKEVNEQQGEQNTAIRPNHLHLHTRERSSTEGKKRYLTSPQTEKRRAMDDMTSISTVSSTQTYNPTSAVDEQNDGASVNKSNSTTCEGSPSEPSARSNSIDKVHDRKSGETSISSSDSGITPRLEEFNLVEEYDKIASQINDNGTVLNEENSSSSAVELRMSSNSSTSVDSGFRNSAEVPSSNRSSGHGVNVDSWSDFENSSDDDENLIRTPSKERDKVPTPSPSVSIKESKEVKLHNIAKELLSTEESYVAVLHLIDQVFHKQVREAAVQKHIIPEQVVNSIFGQVPAIYKFHTDFLLPQLKKRLQSWENNPRIGDVMKQAAPFLKMYSLYVQNFDEAMNSIKLWSEKSSAFSTLIKNIQKLPESNFLTLQHHMLSPVQRVPRYRMLLEDYVKRLPEESEDKEEAQAALKLITVAATHSNETMKKIDKFNKLVKVFNGLADVNFDIVDVSRELLKEGKITKVSARNGEKYERYLYLFSDMLLCCTPLRRLQGKSYRITAKIDLDGMMLPDIKNPTVPNSFCVQGLQKSMEFALGSPEEKEAWVNTIKSAINECFDRKTSFMKQGHAKDDNLAQEDYLAPSNGHAENCPATPTHDRAQAPIEMTAAELGTRAPRWIKDNEVTMCQACSKSFNKILRRRHHCRACGRVICSKCSIHETMLQYDPGKPQKVCEDCYNVLTGRHQGDSSDSDKKGVLEVEADAVSENSVIANYLYVTESEKKKTWTKMWCVIPNDELCLYFYGAHQDVRALTTMPLPGFEVQNYKSNEHKFCFKLSQARRVCYFATDDQGCVERWLYALRLASVGEDLLRDDVYRLGRPKSRNSSFSEDNDSEQDEVSADGIQESHKTLPEENCNQVHNKDGSDGVNVTTST